LDSLRLVVSGLENFGAASSDAGDSHALGIIRLVASGSKTTLYTRLKLKLAIDGVPHQMICTV